MKLIAVRHGEIELNAEGKTTGWLDYDLSPKGEQQARFLARSLTSSLGAIMTSPLLRAVHTAQIIAAEHSCEVIINADLRERNFGSLSGKTWSEIETETGIDLRHIDIDLMNYDYHPYGGESIEDVIARVRRFIHSAANQEGPADVLAVTHGGVIKVLYALLKPPSTQPILNCSIHVFELPRVIKALG